MKHLFLTLSLIVCAIVGLSAQGFYLDIGGGLGMSLLNSSYKYEAFEYYGDFVDYESYTNTDWKNTSELSFDVGLKLGYGFLADIPLYFVGEVSYSNGNTVESKDYRGYGSYSEQYEEKTTFNHIFVGPGIIYYPVPMLQLATSAGMVISTVDYESSYTERYVFNDESYYYIESDSGSGTSNGFGFNFSIAGDIGNQHGLLVGAKFSYIVNKVEIDLPYYDSLNDFYRNTYDFSTAYIGVFAKYRFNM